MSRNVVALLLVLCALLLVVSCSREYVEYKIGDIGPSGGYIFYDCDADNTADGGAGVDGLKSSECNWRFLEAAREDLDDFYGFGYYRDESGANIMVGTKTEVGTGKENTEALVKAMGKTAYVESSGNSKAIYAAKACDRYSVTYGKIVYDDWFLPSRDELYLMYLNLNLDGVGAFAEDDYYWSSSEFNREYSYDENFIDGIMSVYNRDFRGYIRPIRSF